MRIENHLWIGEDGEPPMPRIVIGSSAIDPCDICGKRGPNAWLSADWHGTAERCLDVYVCRECIGVMLQRTHDR